MANEIMERIDHWRTMRRQTQKALTSAYLAIPPETRITYLQGGNEVEVAIVQHNRAAHYVKVRNSKTGREYLLDYDRIYCVLA